MAKHSGSASERLILREALYKWTKTIEYKDLYAAVYAYVRTMDNGHIETVSGFT